MTVIVTVIGAAFWLGSTMATRADLDANMREIRAYIVDHLDGHPAGDND